MIDSINNIGYGEDVRFFEFLGTRFGEKDIFNLPTWVKSLPDERKLIVVPPNKEELEDV